MGNLRTEELRRDLAADSALIKLAKADERRRIREELLEGVTVHVIRFPGSSTEYDAVLVSNLKEALDRICPEEEP